MKNKIKIIFDTFLGKTAEFQERNLTDSSFPAKDVFRDFIIPLIPIIFVFLDRYTSLIFDSNYKLKYFFTLVLLSLSLYFCLRAIFSKKIIQEKIYYQFNKIYRSFFKIISLILLLLFAIHISNINIFFNSMKTISGKIFDSKTGQPIEGVLITPLNPDKVYIGKNYEYSDSEGYFYLDLKTNNGKFLYIKLTKGQCDFELKTESIKILDWIKNRYYNTPFFEIKIDCNEE